MCCVCPTLTPCVRVDCRVGRSGPGHVKELKDCASYAALLMDCVKYTPNVCSLYAYKVKLFEVCQ